MCLPRPDFIQGSMFYCIFCQDFHYHGEGLGHRVSHCGDPKLAKHGYYLEMFSDKTLKEIKGAITEYLEIQADKRKLKRQQKKKNLN